MSLATKIIPEGDPPRPRFPVAWASAFYLVVAAVAVVWRAWLDGGVPSFEAPADPTWQAQGWSRADSLLIGLLSGLGLVIVSRVWSTRFASGRALTEAMAQAVGGLTPAGIAMLTLASSVGEELFFRGALQAQWGWVAASLLFGAAHFGPTPGLRAWSVFALIAGGLFGALHEWSGGLSAPILAHAVVNGINLTWLARVSAGAERGVPRGEGSS